MWLRPQVTNVRNPLQKAVSGGDPPPPGLTRGSPDSQEAHMPPPSPDPYLGQPALHGGLGAPLRHGWRPNGLDLQQALQDTDPFLQQAGRVSRQVVGLLLRDELGGEGVGRGGWKNGPGYEVAQNSGPPGLPSCLPLLHISPTSLHLTSCLLFLPQTHK